MTTDNTPNPEAPAQWTAEDVRQATPAQLSEALRSGVLSDYLAEPLATVVENGEVITVDPHYRGMPSRPRVQPWKPTIRG